MNDKTLHSQNEEDIFPGDITHTLQGLGAERESWISQSKDSPVCNQVQIYYFYYYISLLFYLFIIYFNLFNTLQLCANLCWYFKGT
jgi:hypothetical protein